MKYLKKYESKNWEGMPKWAGLPKFEIGDEVTYVENVTAATYNITIGQSYEVEDVIWSKKRKEYRINLKNVENYFFPNYFPEINFRKTIDVISDKYNL